MSKPATTIRINIRCEMLNDQLDDNSWTYSRRTAMKAIFLGSSSVFATFFTGKDFTANALDMDSFINSQV